MPLFDPYLPAILKATLLTLCTGCTFRPAHVFDNAKALLEGKNPPSFPSRTIRSRGIARFPSHPGAELGRGRRRGHTNGQELHEAVRHLRAGRTLQRQVHPLFRMMIVVNSKDVKFSKNNPDEHPIGIHDLHPWLATRFPLLSKFRTRLALKKAVSGDNLMIQNHWELIGIRRRYDRVGLKREIGLLIPISDTANLRGIRAVRDLQRADGAERSEEGVRNARPGDLQGWLCLRHFDRQKCYRTSSTNWSRTKCATRGRPTQCNGSSPRQATSSGACST